MADKLTTTFTTLESAMVAHKAILAAEPTSKKKVYSVTLPSVEQYASFLETAKASTFYMSENGYAAACYTIIRHLGGECSVGEKSGGSSAAIAAANAAKAAAEEAARKAAAEMESTKQQMASMAKMLEEMKAAQAAMAAANGTQNPEPAKTSKAKGRND